MSPDDVISMESTLDDIFRIAIKRESQAHHFYTEAAKRVHAKETRELLLRLAREEVEHETALTREWKHLRADRDVERAMASDM